VEKGDIASEAARIERRVQSNVWKAEIKKRSLQRQLEREQVIFFGGVFFVRFFILDVLVGTHTSNAKGTRQSTTDGDNNKAQCTCSRKELARQSTEPGQAK
jgi:hypothetical protein